MSTVSILAGAWLLLSVATAAMLGSIAALGHTRRDDRRRELPSAI